VKLVLVAPVYGLEAAGEEARRARAVAEGLLARGHAVEVVATTAVDPETLEPALPAGRTREGDVSVHRVHKDRVAFPEPLRAGGGLVVFFGHRAATTRAGLPAVGRPAVVVAIDPALDKAPSPVAEVARAARVLVDTPEEAAHLGERPFGEGARVVVVGRGLPDVATSGTPPGERRYVAYAGPLEARDGCAAMVDAFLRHQRASRSTLDLVLVGRGRVELRESAHVRFLGDLPAVARRQTLAGALAVLVPARRAALPALCLEAWREARAVVALDADPLVGALLARTGSGLPCRGYDEAAAALELLEGAGGLAEALGHAGRAAFEAEHALPGVLDRYERVLAEVAAEPGRAA
jgi:glycosyltransferase involved in cell wall biosynthesis